MASVFESSEADLDLIAFNFKNKPLFFASRNIGLLKLRGQDVRFDLLKFVFNHPLQVRILR